MTTKSRMTDISFDRHLWQVRGRRLSICCNLLPITYLARSLEELRILINSAVTQDLRPRIMNMRRRFTTDTTSLANGFLMLVVVVGMLNIEPFESDGVSSYNDRTVLYHTELVFSAESPSQSPLLFNSEDVPDSDDAEDRILSSSDFRTTFFDTALLLVQNTGEVIPRPFYSSHNRRSSNIPHQNSDDEEAFILPVDVV